MENEPKSAGTAPIVTKLPAGDHFWCSCGYSAHQPFCDGSHKGQGFTPLKFTLEEEKTVALCTCKKTKNPPYCDGSHSK